MITYSFKKPCTQVQTPAFTVTSPAKRQAEILGLGIPKLLSLLSRASPVKAPHGNARSGQWLFTIKGTVLTHIVKLPSAMVSLFEVQSPVQKDPEKFAMWEECEPCSGAGCPTCKGEGEVQVVRYLKK